ncbi:hypothetical protein MKX08_009076 [Trichoderma sp. CBMAI-0020]|nr:hypothetical protein MKX08_009076 [Trichoderma sp. CBMAI-0020]
MTTHGTIKNEGLHISSQPSLNAVVSAIETNDCNNCPLVFLDAIASSASSPVAVDTLASPRASLGSPINDDTGVCGAYIIPPQIRRPERQFQLAQSSAAQEWKTRKKLYDEASSVLDKLMDYQGLEEVKQHFLDIKSQVKTCLKQGRDLKKQRFNIVFQGSPGTGKTSVARLYAEFMYEMKLLPSYRLKETSGVKLSAKGAKGTKRMIKKMLNNNDGGVLFVDEAYQLIADYSGKRALDIILTYMENYIGRLVVIFVGYKDDMQPFFEHNAGLSSRIPFTITFADFDDGQLWSILRSKADERYGGQMKVEGGLDGLYMRIAIRRLSQARESCSFGNARAIENFLDRIQQRQVQRLVKQNTIADNDVDYFEFTQEDLIGPDPSEAARQCPAWFQLQKLVGIKQVKDNVKRMIGLISANFKRELNEQRPLTFSLKCLFVGAPGTGKTTVAKLYGQILADLGYLSRGDVICKTPADFIRESLGSSEAKTKKILEATIGKVLVIDETYMLDAGDPHKGQDSYKTGVIDTIVSIVQGMPGEDRCIILVGILQLKLQNEELTASEDAIKEARDVLERALLRSGFSNAAEVDALLATAKKNYEERQSQLPPELQTYDGVIEACDINPKSKKASPEELDYHQRFGGRIHRSIIDRLIRYWKRYSRAKSLGLNTRENIPTRFIFRGSPGTGKSTTAQFMGEVFHEIGFLSIAEVIECSATDLLGQYVGQTAPKARRKLHESLGRVLLIDEAHRFLQNQYAAEALDELIYFLTLPANLGKVVVILAGHIEDMH